MAPIISDDLPTRVAAGTTIKFHRSFGDFLASDGWTYKFHANGPTTRLDIAATTNADGHSFDIVIPANVASLTTPSFASLPAGRYECGERLTHAGEVVDPNLDSLQLVVEADVSTSPAGAFISHVERMLAVIEAALEGRLTDDIVSYQIAGRAVVKIQPKELLWFRGHYKSKLYQLKNPGRLGSTIAVAFTNEPEDPFDPPTWVDTTGLN